MDYKIKSNTILNNYIGFLKALFAIKNIQLAYHNSFYVVKNTRYAVKNTLYAIKNTSYASEKKYFKYANKFLIKY